MTPKTAEKDRKTIKVKEEMVKTGKITPLVATTNLNSLKRQRNNQQYLNLLQPLPMHQNPTQNLPQLHLFKIHLPTPVPTHTLDAEAETAEEEEEAMDLEDPAEIVETRATTAEKEATVEREVTVQREATVEREAAVEVGAVVVVADPMKLSESLPLLQCIWMQATLGQRTRIGTAIFC